MAVQAQYPSKSLLLNRGILEGRNQIGNDYSMQAKGVGSGEVLDQSHFILNNTNTPLGNNHNPRKRGRETNAITPMDSILSSSMQQQFQCPQLIDLAQLHNPTLTPHNAVVSTGLQLAFGDQQLQNHRQQSFSPQSSTVLSMLSEDFATQIKQQRDDIDQFLQAQGEHLRRTLAEKRQEHYHALLRAAGVTLAKRLKEKELDVEKAMQWNGNLQAKATHFSDEVQVWQARVTDQETMLAKLQAQLQQAIMNHGCIEKPERGQSCASTREVEDAESMYIDPERVEMFNGPSCKACGKRVASVVLLPCRHLSVCTECDGVIQACPLCLCLRSSGVEVFLE